MNDMRPGLGMTHEECLREVRKILRTHPGVDIRGHAKNVMAVYDAAAAALKHCASGEERGRLAHALSRVEASMRPVGVEDEGRVRRRPAIQDIEEWLARHQDV